MPQITQRESDIEKYLTFQVSVNGGETRKVGWINRRHAPDRAVLLNGIHLVELKAPGEKPRPGQEREHIRLAKLRVKVWVLSTEKEVDNFIKNITCKPSRRAPTKP